MPCVECTSTTPPENTMCKACLGWERFKQRRCRDIKQLLYRHQIPFRYEYVATLGKWRDTPDFVIDTLTHSIAIEIDEGQIMHKMYPHLERERLTRFVEKNPRINSFILYNPEHKDGVSPSRRYDVMIQTIHKCMKKTKYTMVVKLFLMHLNSLSQE
jgi:hypothetical protein